MGLFSLMRRRGGGGENAMIARIKGLAPIRYWPLYDAAGTTDTVELMAADNGTAANVTFGSTGIGDGNTAGAFNGTTSKINIYSSALNTDMNKAEGVWGAWVYLSTAVLADSTWRTLAQLRADGDNRVYLLKSATAGRLDVNYTAGAASKNFGTTGLTQGWHHFAVRWSVSDDAASGWHNGVQSGAALDTLGTWAGNLAAGNCLIGASSTTPTDVTDGTIAHVTLFDNALSDADMLTLGTQP